jgi:tetratricopeptide (TPR) repeat protein
LMAIDKGNDNAMNNLGLYYQQQKDYDNMMKYYLMAIDKGDSDAMFNLGLYYKQQKDYDNMMKYYLMAIDKGDSDSVNELNNTFNKLSPDLLKLTTQYIKYLSKTNLIILNEQVENEKINCVVCYETFECAFKYCSCGQNIMCKSCYLKWSKCVNCEN